MRICPQCRTAHPAGTLRCRKDGTDLVDASEVLDAKDELLGLVIADRYRLEERIGLGGMGTVYRATQIGLGRSVAVKVLKKEVSLDRDAVTRFHREAKAMSLLVHPNTVRVFDFGETDDGLLYLAMELLEGEVLSVKSEREHQLDVEEAVRITQQILSSLHEAHSKGLIHRDLKPDNIFLAQVEGHADPVVKVLDFGIAKAWHGERKLDQLETQAGTVFGTPRYMSPEQAQGHKLDPRSDVYGVGILLYQMLVGEPPFVDDDAVVVMAKHIREDPVRVRRAAPERPIPAELERVAMRSLEKNPRRRFQSAEEFIDALEACLPEVLRARARHGGRAVPVPALAVAVAVLLSAVGVSGYVLWGAPQGGTGPVPHGGAVRPAPDPAAAPDETRDEGTDSNASAVAENETRVEQPITAHIVSTPPGAGVWLDGTHIGETPLDHVVPSGTAITLELRKEGYKVAEVEVPEDGRLDPVILERERIPHRRGRARPRRRAHTGRGTGTSTQTAPAHDEPYERFD